jgi:hypothetical protein
MCYLYKLDPAAKSVRSPVVYDHGHLCKPCIPLPVSVDSLIVINSQVYLQKKLVKIINIFVFFQVNETKKHD